MTAESYLINSNQVGTSHGTGYSYDTHVPLLIYGWNVTPGSSNENIIVQDIAPTLHGLLKLNTNTSFDGENRRNLMN
jgi:arylsulfatase A-like enzyme